MLLFIIRRLFSSALVLLSVVTITVLLSFTMKGGPFDREKEPPPHVKKALLARYKLDGSTWEKYVSYMRDLLHGDLRVSYRYKDWTVGEVLTQKMPTSIQIGSVAFVIASLGGVLAGSLAAMRRNGAVDLGVMLWALLAVSIPTFVSGPLLVYVFGIELRWLPIGGWGSWRHVVLPGVCLAMPFLAYVARLMRNSLLEVLQSDFMRTARAKGVGEVQALTMHAMKVAILPVITYLGPLAANLLTGSMIVESVFNISGAGTVFVNSIQNKDYFLLVGAVAIYCVLVIAFNLVVDILYGFLDKRIKIYG
ncbi:MAG: Oligopeptide transport system permease protein [Verrucomicrobiaceae bacterium]|nr:Oligopeptide transport system permease protein [Verrucomicrobiaceae bacterium]